jgi:dTDP-4-amino-4,6-dideoxygalactose transaminase
MEGVNSRLDPLQAAMLEVKCRHLPRWTEQRIAKAKQYSEQLGNVDQVTIPAVRKGTLHTFHQYVIQATQRNKLREFLSRHGIQTMIHYPTSLPNLPAFRHLHHSIEDFPVASRSQDEVLSLPIHPELSNEQIAYVCEMISKFYSTN